MTKLKEITIKQIASPIGRNSKQKSILIGLGLNRLNKTKIVKSTPEILGMINKVPHLVKIID